jgi:hypothetical protein
MKLLLHAFPSDFRRRYGDELLELVGTGGAPLRDGANLVLAGLRVRLDEIAREFGSLKVGGQARAVAVIGLASTASAALGGCMILGSVAVAGGGALLVHRARGAATIAY